MESGKKETNKLHLYRSKVRVLEVFKGNYWNVYNNLNQKEKDKFDYVMQIVLSLGRVPSHFLKHIMDGIYEIRIQAGKKNYRVFSFFTDDRRIVLLNVIQKKTQKISRADILIAKKLRQEYYEAKESGDN